MTGEIYRRLADALDRLANGFPRTETGVELQILAHVFTPEEAEVAAALTGRPAEVEEVAQRAGLEPVPVAATLQRLAGRSVIWTVGMEDRVAYRLAPFLPVGFYEAHTLEEHDPEYARLIEAYFCGGGAAGIMGPQPAIHRVLPARRATETEWVLPYDDVRALLDAATSFASRPASAACSRRSSASAAATSLSRPASGSPTPRAKARDTRSPAKRRSPCSTRPSASGSCTR